jgi:hypothetical protein
MACTRGKSDKKSSRRRWSAHDRDAKSVKLVPMGACPIGRTTAVPRLHRKKQRANSAGELLVISDGSATDADRDEFFEDAVKAIVHPRRDKCRGQRMPRSWSSAFAIQVRATAVRVMEAAPERDFVKYPRLTDRSR